MTRSVQWPPCRHPKRQSRQSNCLFSHPSTDALPLFPLSLKASKATLSRLLSSLSFLCFQEFSCVFGFGITPSVYSFIRNSRITQVQRYKTRRRATRMYVGLPAKIRAPSPYRLSTRYGSSFSTLCHAKGQYGDRCDMKHETIGGGAPSPGLESPGHGRELMALFVKVKWFRTQ